MLTVLLRLSAQICVHQETAVSAYFSQAEPTLFQIFFVSLLQTNNCCWAWDTPPAKTKLSSESLLIKIPNLMLNPSVL